MGITYVDLSSINVGIKNFILFFIFRLGYGLKGDFKGRGNGPRGTWSGRPTKDKAPHHRHGHSKRETPGSKLPSSKFIVF